MNRQKCLSQQCKLKHDGSPKTGYNIAHECSLERKQSHEIGKSGDEREKSGNSRRCDSTSDGDRLCPKHLGHTTFSPERPPAPSAVKSHRL